MSSPQGYWPSARLLVKSQCVCDSCCVLAPQSWRPRSIYQGRCFLLPLNFQWNLFSLYHYFLRYWLQTTYSHFTSSIAIYIQKHNPLSPQPFMCYCPEQMVPFHWTSIAPSRDVWITLVLCEGALSRSFVSSPLVLFFRYMILYLHKLSPWIKDTQVSRTFPLWRSSVFTNKLAIYLLIRFIPFQRAMKRISVNLSSLYTPHCLRQSEIAQCQLCTSAV